MDAAYEKHVSLESLWKYSKEGKKPNLAEIQHLIGCEYCIGTLGLCTLHSSLAEIQEWDRLLDET